MPWPPPLPCVPAAPPGRRARPAPSPGPPTSGRAAPPRAENQPRLTELARAAGRCPPRPGSAIQPPSASRRSRRTHRVAGWTWARKSFAGQKSSTAPRSMGPSSGSPGKPAVEPSGSRSRTREVVQPMARSASRAARSRASAPGVSWSSASRTFDVLALSVRERDGAGHTGAPGTALTEGHARVVGDVAGGPRRSARPPGSPSAIPSPSGISCAHSDLWASGRNIADGPWTAVTTMRRRGTAALTTFPGMW